MAAHARRTPRTSTDGPRSTDRAEDGGSPGEAKARAWLKAHSNDPLVAGASLPQDHRRSPETGETVDLERMSMLPGGGEVSGTLGRKHRATVSYSGTSMDAWERSMAPGSYTPIVARGGLTPEQLDKRIRVDRALARLKPKQRELLHMRYSEQLSLEAIAAEQGGTYQAAQQRLVTATQDFVRAVGDTWLDDYDLLGEVFG